MPGQALEDLQHDHAHLSRLVVEVGELVVAWSASPTEPSARAELGDTVEALLDDLTKHFAREEEGLFPFVTARLPSLADRISRLSTLHDALCGALARLSRNLSGDGPSASIIVTVTTAFERFQDSYAEHAREERELLEHLPRVLGPTDREALRAILAAL